MNTVRFKRFTINIISNNQFVERLIYNNYNYFVLPNKSIFQIILGNETPVRVDAYVQFNDQHVGTYRINPFSNITINKPLRLYNESSREFYMNGLEPGNPKNGLIQVTFYPERYIPTSTLPNGQFHENETCYDYTDTVTRAGGPRRQCLLTAENYLKKRHLSVNNELNFIAKTNNNNIYPIEDVDINNITKMFVRMIVDTDQTSYRNLQTESPTLTNPSIPPPVLDIKHPARPRPCNIDSKFSLDEKTYYFAS